MSVDVDQLAVHVDVFLADDLDLVAAVVLGVAGLVQHVLEVGAATLGRSFARAAARAPGRSMTVLPREAGEVVLVVIPRLSLPSRSPEEISLLRETAVAWAMLTAFCLSSALAVMVTPAGASSWAGVSWSATTSSAVPGRSCPGRITARSWSAARPNSEPG